MKQTIIGFLTVIAIAVISFLIFKSCQDKPTPLDSTRETELIKEIEQKNDHIAELSKKVDSLETVKQKVKTQIVIREREIDANILKDSSNSIVEYRRSLQDNQELPDGTEELTYREIGIGSKLMARVPKMQLQINLCEEQSFNKDIIIADKEYIIGGYKEVIEIKNNNIEYWQEMYEEESSFWNSKELWFGIGVLVSAGIVFASGALK